MQIKALSFHLKTLSMFWLVSGTMKARLEVKREKPHLDQGRDKRTRTQNCHKQILLLSETKLNLNVINYHAKVYWFFVFSHDSREFYFFWLITKIFPFKTAGSVV